MNLRWCDGIYTLQRKSAQNGRRQRRHMSETERQWSKTDGGEWVSWPDEQYAPLSHSSRERESLLGTSCKSWFTKGQNISSGIYFTTAAYSITCLNDHLAVRRIETFNGLLAFITCTLQGRRVDKGLHLDSNRMTGRRPRIRLFCDLTNFGYLLWSQLYIQGAEVLLESL